MFGPKTSATLAEKIDHLSCTDQIGRNFTIWWNSLKTKTKLSQADQNFCKMYITLRKLN
jgi:ribosomal protein L33